MPPALSQDPRDRLGLWLVDLDAARDRIEAAEAAAPRLAPDDLARASGHADPRQRARWRTARIALRIGLERLASRSWRRQPFVIEAHGRPVLPGTGLAFSLAHTMVPDAAHALLAVATVGPLGVDIERERDIAMAGERRASLRRAGLALSRHEPPASSDVAAWVRLEALGKADGRGVWPVLEAAGVHGSRAVTPDQATARVRGIAHAIGVALADVVLPQPLLGAVAAPPSLLAGAAIVPGGLDDLLAAGAA